MTKLYLNQTAIQHVRYQILFVKMTVLWRSPSNLAIIWIIYLEMYFSVFPCTFYPARSLLPRPKMFLGCLLTRHSLHLIIKSFELGVNKLTLKQRETCTNMNKPKQPPHKHSH